MQHKNSEKASHADNAPSECLTEPQIKSRITMILHNHSLDHFKNCLRLQLGCLPCTLHLNMACFRCDFYFGYFKKTVTKLIYFYSLFVNISQFTLAARTWTSVSVS